MLSRGKVLFQYDALDRLVAAVSEQGVVGYRYDALGRLIERTLNGTEPTTVTQDRTNRVKTITLRGRSVRDDYDGAGRLSVKTLSNGFSEHYAGDAADRLTGITWRRADAS